MTTNAHNSRRVYSGATRKNGDAQSPAGERFNYYSLHPEMRNAQPPGRSNADCVRAWLLKNGRGTARDIAADVSCHADTVQNLLKAGKIVGAEIVGTRHEGKGKSHVWRIKPETLTANI